MTRVFDIPASAISVAKFIQRKVENGSFEKAIIEERLYRLAEAVDEKKIKEEDKISTKKINSNPSPSPRTDMSDYNKNNQTAYITLTSSDE